MQIVYKIADNNQELHQILELQQQNILSSITPEEKQTEGFVSVHHTFELLTAMNNKCAHIVAKNNNRVVGYALSMVKDFKNDIDVLKPMFLPISLAV